MGLKSGLESHGVCLCTYAHMSICIDIVHVNICAYFRKNIDIDIHIYIHTYTLLFVDLCICAMYVGR